jgi:hypothetical protein
MQKGSRLQNNKLRLEWVFAAMDRLDVALTKSPRRPIQWTAVDQ